MMNGPTETQLSSLYGSPLAVETRHHHVVMFATNQFRPTGSAFILKWDHLGEQQLRFKNDQSSAASLTIEFQTPVVTPAQEMCIRSFVKRLLVAEQLHTSLRSRQESAGVVESSNTGLSGTMLPAVINHASLSGSLMEESGFGG